MKTLAALARYKIDPKRIYIFVANAAEADIYKATLDATSYNSIIIGVIQIGRQRNFISDFFPEGTYIVSMDDDITSFMEWNPECPRNEAELPDLEETIYRGFELCRREHCALWGVYPVSNGYFMSEGHSTELKYIIGSFNGMINPGTKNKRGVKLLLELDKEDYERSCRFYLRDGRVVRLNDVSVKSAYYTEKGGNQEFRTTDSIRAGADRLVEMFPGLATLNLTKKSGKAEVRLSDKRLPF